MIFYDDALELINLSTILLVISFLFLLLCINQLLSIYLFKTQKNYNNVEKNNQYECGFDPFSTTLTQIEIKYYNIAVLFLIFDVELLLLLPISTLIDILKLLEFLIFFSFILSLVISFNIEWQSFCLFF